jgi:hypothetical protein
MKIIQLVVLPYEGWATQDADDRSRSTEYELLGLDDEGGVWTRSRKGWEPHTAPELVR